MLIFIFSSVGIFSPKNIIFIRKLKFTKKFKIINQVINYFKSFNSIRLTELLKYFLFNICLTIRNFILIFFISMSLLAIDNSILFSLIVTMSTDLSFIFTFTPYALGISETFIFFQVIILILNFLKFYT